MIACVPPDGTGVQRAALRPFWAAAEDIGAPISIHTLTSNRKGNLSFHRGSGRRRAGYPETPMEVMLTLGEMLTSPLFDRHPRLKLVLAEADTGLAAVAAGAASIAVTSATRGRTACHTELKPSEYFHRNVSASFIGSRRRVHPREFMGVDNLMWSSDYPHTDSTWPRSRESIAHDFAGVSERIASR